MFCEVGKFHHGEKFALVGDRLEVEDELQQHEEAVVVVASIIGEETLEICRKNPKEFRAKMSALLVCTGRFGVPGTSVEELVLFEGRDLGKEYVKWRILFVGGECG